MYIHVRVSVNSRSESFAEIKDLHFSACVRQKAEHNEANKRVMELIASYHGISTKAVRIVSGHHSPRKLFSIPDSD